LIRSLLVYRIMIKITIAIGLLFTPRNKEVMEPCHVTGMFQTSMSSTVMATSQEKKLER
jgi:hypothetical protein